MREAAAPRTAGRPRRQRVFFVVNCASRADRGVGCASVPRTATRWPEHPRSFSGCHHGRAGPSLPTALLTRLSQGLCDLASFFATHARNPPPRPSADQPALRARASIAEPPRWPEPDRAGFSEAAEFVPE
jgi:hypothetical protein